MNWAISKFLLPVRYKSDTGREEEVATDAATVKILSVHKAGKDKKGDMKPIKGPAAFDLRAFWSWVFGMLATVLGILVGVLIAWRLHKKFIDPESLKAPDERVLLELGRLKKKRFLEEHRDKEYYSELSDILRRYLERQFRVEALEQTSAELLLKLKSADFSDDAVRKIKAFLEQTDLVKFARFVPERKAGEELTERLVEIVNQTKPHQEKKA